MSFISNSPNSCLETIQHLIYFENVLSIKNELHLVTMAMESKVQCTIDYLYNTLVHIPSYMLSFKVTQHATLEVTQ